MTNPLLNALGLMDFGAVKPEDVKPALETLLAQARETVSQVTAPETPATWEAVNLPLHRVGQALWRAWGTAHHLQSVVDTPALREAVNAMLPEVTAFSISLGQNLDLMKKYQAMNENAASMAPLRARILARNLRDFHLSGADLPDTPRARLQEIGSRLAQCSQTFKEHVLDATNAWFYHTTNREELAGIPESDLAFLAAQAQARDLDGWVVTLHYPSYLAVMQHADNRELRARVHYAFATRASDLGDKALDNTPLMDEILALRQEEATLLGFKNFGELSLATKMAQTPDEVKAFLMELAQKARPYAFKDKADLEAFAREHLALTEVEPWDWAWASEKLRQARYSFSESEVRAYFTEPTVFAGLFDLAERLYGVTFKATTASVWHPDVKVFEVLRNGTPIALFYADLYAREGKNQGAWMNDDRTPEVVDGHAITPTAFLICNFAHGVDGKAATLTHDDVTTLFHEFGHCLHHLLTEQTEPDVAGINGVEWDAVELPSQFMENFAWDWTVLSRLTQHETTGEPLPRALFDKMLAAKNFQSGLACLRQIEFALFDMRLHTTPNPVVTEVLAGVRRDVAVLEASRYSRFPQSFSHIFSGGYAAGYYSYKWAEVLSADAFAAFEEDGVVSRAVGERFLSEILGRGSSRDALDNFIAFRGRRPSIEALLRHTGMTEPLTD